MVGGDAKEPGAYPDGLSLLREMAEIGHPLGEIGIPGYPQGHAFIADGPLLEALRAKAAFASYITTQLCFDPAAIATWLAARRAEGIDLPVHVGIPGVAEPQKLLTIAARIGVADTHRFLVKNVRFVTRLIRSGGFYRPDGLLEGLASAAADPAMGISGLHIYTFNAVEATEGWRRSTLATSREARRSSLGGRSRTMTTRAERLEACASFPERLASRRPAAADKPAPTRANGVTTDVVRHLIAVESEVHQSPAPAGRCVEDPHGSGPSRAWRPGSRMRTCRRGSRGVRDRPGGHRSARPRADEDGWARFGTHSTYGRLDVEGLLRLASDHDAEHLEALDESVANDGSG